MIVMILMDMVILVLLTVNDDTAIITTITVTIYCNTITIVDIYRY